MRVTRWIGEEGEELLLQYLVQYAMVLLREGGREGGRVPHPPAAPQLGRTHADGRGRGLSGWEREGFPMFRMLPSGGGGGGDNGDGRWGGTPISSHIRECHPSQRQSTSDRIPGRLQSQQGSGGVGSHPRSPAPGSPSPSLPRERNLGEPVFPGVQIVDRGHWVPQRLPRAGRRHHARAPRRCSGG